MKKDLIFAPILFIIGLMLFLLKFTGMTAHIVLSALGVAVLVAYAVLTKKEWKLPILEIAMRVLYGIAFVTGIVIMNVSGVVALAVIHRVCAILFVAALLVLVVHKFVSSSKE